MFSLMENEHRLLVFVTEVPLTGPYYRCDFFWIEFVRI
jgi:hypothetical protein